MSDVGASARWYEEALGFQRIAVYGDAVHMRRGEGQDVLLRPGGAGVALHMATDLSLGDLAGEHTAEGGADAPETVELRDPDGNVLRVFARQRPGPSR